MATETGLFSDRHSGRDGIRHAGATPSVRGKSDCNGSCLCHPRPELARILGATITDVGGIETEALSGSTYSAARGEKSAEPDGLVVSSVEDTVNPIVPFPDLHSNISNPRSVKVRTVGKEKLYRHREHHRSHCAKSVPPLGQFLPRNSLSGTPRG